MSRTFGKCYVSFNTVFSHTNFVVNLHLSVSEKNLELLGVVRRNLTVARSCGVGASCRIRLKYCRQSVLRKRTWPYLPRCDCCFCPVKSGRPLKRRLATNIANFADQRWCVSEIRLVMMKQIINIRTLWSLARSTTWKGRPKYKICIS